MNFLSSPTRNKCRSFVANIQILSQTGQSSKAPRTKLVPSKNCAKSTELYENVFFLSIICLKANNFSVNKIMIQQRISLVKTLRLKTFPGCLWNLNPNFSFACDLGEAHFSRWSVLGYEEDDRDLVPFGRSVQCDGMRGINH